ncbi:MAG: serine protease, partial [Flavobacterium sp.]|nr:serine protease [Flavobacterium sp.]
MQQTGQFYWKNASLQMLWSATQHGSNLVTIGYGTSTSDFEKSTSGKALDMEKKILK